ncbi:MAG: porin family protein [Candidatus Aminicenantes bacterium]|nr:porin family protein [Candidatus Aminicenantes bacterium]MDH5466282.1 porin family protein [Candidatus Aminicenantes bacterium]MDH5705875.1 porin family protein [Candidatus Aminicenantes bacterium]
MKKERYVYPIILIALFLLAASAQADDLGLGFSFKVGGGISQVRARDLNAYGEGYENHFDDIAASWLSSKEGEFNDLNTLGGEVGIDVLFNFTENFAIGFGFGNFPRKSQSDFSLQEEGVISFTAILDPRISNSSLTLSLYYFYPFTSNLRVYINPGAGLYLSKMALNTNSEYDETGVLSYSETVELSTNDLAFGFQGGLGMEVTVGGYMGLFIEASGRYCKLKSYRGRLKYTFLSSEGAVVARTSSGDLWYFEKYNPSLANWYSQVQVSEEAPVGSDIRNARAFTADLSGFSIKIGIRLKL